MVYRNTRPRKAPPARRHRKRWYVDASIPKSVPFIGGSSFKAGSGTLQKRSMERIARSVLNQQKETKQLVTSNSQSLVHDTIYTWAPTQNLVLGFAASQREGDSIYLRKIKVRGRIELPSTIAQGQYRMMALWLPAERTAASTSNPLVPSGVGSSEIFLPSVHPLYSRFINNKLNSKVICEKRINISPQTAGNAKSVTFNLDCSFFRKMQFKSPGGTLFKDEQLYFVLMGQTPNGTAGTTNIGIVHFDFLVTYND